ncbi:hypothetical protein SPRG_20349 [Saprolegnia parasitica CBS 223.65]|uniref:CCDC93 coiled-coil domain-containing protein n=1 Tax=Saprolegnia parasitica (strain CBS 223.65) TaxID=695850 RepID=A0A067CFI4_SAPPC|nr:hypothetical protein SPRG_20349 [Saprolegnia parasitica CBS 223.65]KDO27945.1 hypothetical protein SPRG_20349 [Saprolegnia parasitica CBS 223.65]|eukprot:XP_012201465.1 hypothetical protein SPRG_20349 [Saprolegnia parasitica CBS 223.65]
MAREEGLLRVATAAEERSWRHTGVADLESVDAAIALYDVTSEDIRSRSCPEEAAALSFVAETRRLEREAQRLTAKLDAQAALVAQLQGTHARLVDAAPAAQLACATLDEKRAALKVREAAIAAAEDASNETSSDLAKLRKLISLHTSLKLQEATFKAACKQELTGLQAQVDALPGLETDERRARLEAKLAVLATKRTALKQEVGKEARAVVAALRLLDDIPCKVELLQYEKRFMELYEEVALTLEETRKYYSVYNTLEATHEYLEKEVALVESINANFEIALKSKAATDVFFSQMTAVIGNVRANVAKQQVQCDAKQLTVDTLDSKYQLLLAKQQAYVTAIRDFQRECEKNEKLQAHLDASQ